MVLLSHSEYDNNPIPVSHRWFMGAYKRSYILHNILHNESVGILPVCSGWEQWSVCWSENNQVHSLKQQKTLATHNLQQKKKLLHTNHCINNKQNQPLFKWTLRNGGWKINRRHTVLFFQLWVNNLEQIFKWFIKTSKHKKKKKKNLITVAKHVFQQKLVSHLGVRCFTIYGVYTVQQK